jgi:ubiquinone/menaquinone biosynthesis C-methylase UbiE
MTAGPDGDLTPLVTTRRPSAARELRLLGLDRLARGARVLEIGTGEGRLALGYAAAARSVLAIDPDPAAIARAREHAARRGLSRVRFEIAAAQELEVGRERFDLAVLAWSL